MADSLTYTVRKKSGETVVRTVSGRSVTDVSVSGGGSSGSSSSRGNDLVVVGVEDAGSLQSREVSQSVEDVPQNVDSNISLANASTVVSAPRGEVVSGRIRSISRDVVSSGRASAPVLSSVDESPSGGVGASSPQTAISREESRLSPREVRAQYSSRERLGFGVRSVGRAVGNTVRRVGREGLALSALPVSGGLAFFGGRGEVGVPRFLRQRDIEVSDLGSPGLERFVGGVVNRPEEAALFVTPFGSGRQAVGLVGEGITVLRGSRAVRAVEGTQAFRLLNRGRQVARSTRVGRVLVGLGEGSLQTKAIIAGSEQIGILSAPSREERAFLRSDVAREALREGFESQRSEAGSRGRLGVIAEGLTVFGGRREAFIEGALGAGVSNREAELLARQRGFLGVGEVASFVNIGRYTEGFGTRGLLSVFRRGGTSIPVRRSFGELFTRIGAPIFDAGVVEGFQSEVIDSSVRKRDFRLLGFEETNIFGREVKVPVGALPSAAIGGVSAGTLGGFIGATRVTRPRLSRIVEVGANVVDPYEFFGDITHKGLTRFSSARAQARLRSLDIFDSPVPGSRVREINPGIGDVDRLYARAFPEVPTVLTPPELSLSLGVSPSPRGKVIVPVSSRVPAKTIVPSSVPVSSRSDVPSFISVNIPFTIPANTPVSIPVQQSTPSIVPSSVPTSVPSIVPSLVPTTIPVIVAGNPELLPPLPLDFGGGFGGSGGRGGRSKFVNELESLQLFGNVGRNELRRYGLMETPPMVSRGTSKKKKKGNRLSPREKAIKGYSDFLFGGVRLF